MILQHSNSRIENMKDEFVFVIERFIFKCEFIVYDECFSIFMIQKLYTIGWTISVNNWVIEPNFAMFLRQCISFIIFWREKKRTPNKQLKLPLLLTSKWVSNWVTCTAWEKQRGENVWLHFVLLRLSDRDHKVRKSPVRFT